MTVTVKNINEIEQAALLLIPYAEKTRVVVFVGKMGVGKTTLISAMCKHWGVSDPVNSPTFSIVNEYHTSQNECIYHFDFYRINHLQEAIDLGIMEYLESNQLCLMEWAEKIAPLLPNSFACIKMEETENGERKIECQYVEQTT